MPDKTSPVWVWAGANPATKIEWQTPRCESTWTLDAWDSRFVDSFLYSSALDPPTTLYFNTKGAKVQHDNPTSPNIVRLQHQWTPNVKVVETLLSYGGVPADISQQVKALVPNYVDIIFEGLAQWGDLPPKDVLDRLKKLDPAYLERFARTCGRAAPVWAVDAALQDPQPDVEMLREFIGRGCFPSAANRKLLELLVSDYVQVYFDAAGKMGQVPSNSVLDRLERLKPDYLADLVQYVTDTLNRGGACPGWAMDLVLRPSSPEIAQFEALLVLGVVPSEASLRRALRLPRVYLEVLLSHDASAATVATLEALQPGAVEAMLDSVAGVPPPWSLEVALAAQHLRFSVVESLL